MKRNVQHIPYVYEHTHIRDVMCCVVLCCVVLAQTERNYSYATSDKKVVTFHIEAVTLTEVLVAMLKLFFAESI